MTVKATSHIDPQGFEGGSLFREHGSIDHLSPPQTPELGGKLGLSPEEVREIVAALLVKNADLGEAAMDLGKQANTDSLTGIGNRRSFEEKVQRMLDNDETFILLFVDLDRFKQVNDTKGHKVGDDVLCDVTTGIVETLQLRNRGGAEGFVEDSANDRRPRKIREDESEKSDGLFRLGGDEFAVVLPMGSLPRPAIDSREFSDLMSSSSKVIAIVTDRIRSVVVEVGEEYEASFLGISVGYWLSVPGVGPRSIEGICQIADMELYDEKTEKRSYYPNIPGPPEL